MKSICITLVSVFMSVAVFSQISSDTAYSKQWNNKNDQWENFDRTISTYNNGLIASELIQVYESDSWVNYNLKDYYYNNGQLIEEFEQYWNESKERWLDNYRKLYSYDQEGRLAQITHQEIYNGNYVNSSREIMEYSEGGKLQNKVVQKYDEAWTNFLKYEYYYLANDLLTEENLAYWDNDNWTKPGIAVRYSYDSNGNLTEKTKG